MAEANDDLLSGTVPRAEEQTSNMGLEEHSHRLSLQRWLFSIVLVFALMLYLVAIIIGLMLINMLRDHSELHWHASILIAAFIIPPTVITVGLMRGIFKDKDEKKDPADDAANQSIVDIGKEATKEFAKEVGKAFAKTKL